MMVTTEMRTKQVTSTKPIRFIGSKTNLLSHIEKLIKQYCDNETNLICGDLFCGTAVVSSHLKKLGYSVIANDNLTFCTTLAKAILLINNEPQFSKLIESGEIPKKQWKKIVMTPYDQVLYFLNSLSGITGFFYNEYSPNKTGKTQRKYFTEKNAKKIDAIREKIAQWQSENLISDSEASLLISDLIKATNKVANIAGTYGYFLKDWDPRTENDLTLTYSEIIPSDKQHFVFKEDANKLVKRIDCDVLYLDPPYTWRHYGAYYHILETLAKWDNPVVDGLSGLRPWEDSKSRYCYRDESEPALKELIENSKAKHIFLSYNSDGLISHEQLFKTLSIINKPIVHEIEYRRYKSNNGSKENVVKERIYYVKRE